jgi:Fe2+ transport system protein B
MVSIMPKKNFISEAADGFFDLISTGYARFDSFVRRMVQFILLLMVLVWSVSALTGLVDTIGTTVGNGMSAVVEKSAAGSKIVVALISPSELSVDITARQAAMQAAADAAEPAVPTTPD